METWEFNLDLGFLDTASICPQTGRSVSLQEAGADPGGQLASATTRATISQNLSLPLPCWAPSLERVANTIRHHNALCMTSRWTRYLHITTQIGHHNARQFQVLWKVSGWSLTKSYWLENKLISREQSGHKYETLRKFPVLACSLWEAG